MQKLHLTISTGDLKLEPTLHQSIERLYLNVLSALTKQDFFEAKPSTYIYEDATHEFDERDQFFGDENRGLHVHAISITSSQGTHGERADWTFHGLPKGISLSGDSRYDCRYPSEGYVSLDVETEDATLLETVVEHFKGL